MRKLTKVELQENYIKDLKSLLNRAESKVELLTRELDLANDRITSFNQMSNMSKSERKAVHVLSLESKVSSLNNKNKQLESMVRKLRTENDRLLFNKIKSQQLSGIQSINQSSFIKQ